MSVRGMLSAHPGAPIAGEAALARCIDECHECSGTCTVCADACLGEVDVGPFVRCIRLCLDCASVCVAAADVSSRQTEPNRNAQRIVLEACASACRVCAEECERHAHHHEHCRLCAEECRRCEHACTDPAAAVGA